MIHWDHNLATSVDLAVASTIIFGIYTFLRSRVKDKKKAIEDAQQASFNKYWASLSIYASVTLNNLLIQRDNLTKLYSDFDISVARKDGKADPNILIEASHRASHYIKFSIIEAFQCFGGSHAEVAEAVKTIAASCKNSQSNLEIWRKNMLRYFVDKDMSIIEIYRGESGSNDFLAYPASELTRLYGSIASQISFHDTSHATPVLHDTRQSERGKNT